MVRICRRNQAARDRGDPVTGRAGRFVFWQEMLNRRPPHQRPCIHHMKGRIDFKACHKSYQCIDCEFDQFFQDRFKVYTRIEAVDFSDIKGFFLPAGYYLGHGHIWVRLEGNSQVSMGIDDFVSRLLGPFDALSAPLLGKALSRGGSAFTLGRKDKTVSFLSPVSGVVTESNPCARNQPESITRSPYTDGWILTLHCPDLKSEIRDLLFMDTAAAFMAESAKQLYGFLEYRTGLKAADGGQLAPDIYGNLADVTWNELVTRFLA